MKTHFPILLFMMLLPACKKAPAPAAMPPPVVQVMETVKKKVTNSTAFVGQLDSPENVEIRARVESFIEKMLFKEGDEVKAGDPLFELDKRPNQEKLAAAKGQLAEAQAALAKSKQDVARLTPLVAQNAVAKRDLDDAVIATQGNEASVAAAEAKVKTAEIELSYCDIRAPIDGRIGARQVAVGSLVGKGEPTLLATISKVDPMWCYCSISEVDFLNFDRLAREAGREMGQLPVTLLLADGTEHPEPGKWVFIDRIIDATTATIRVRAEFPNPRKILRPGMFARVKLSAPARDETIVIPERALVELQGRSFVWVIDGENKAHQRPVEVMASRVGAEAVVTKGLEAGERVVVEGVNKLREGVVAKPVTATELAAAASAAAKAPAADAAKSEAKPATK
ncbi:MAG: efflux RND transporter periplasmic adaptor subunit [Verrucomicrobiaceae bacterium]|nr:efflux RND transporter periplasmic adaptor subunit [Verrucomicrobiaceae bacterium]